MNAQNPCSRFGPGSRLIFCAPGERTSMMSQIDRNLADEAIAFCQTASRAHRQGALKDAAATLQTR